MKSKQPTEGKGIKEGDKVIVKNDSYYDIKPRVVVFISRRYYYLTNALRAFRLDEIKKI